MKKELFFPNLSTFLLIPGKPHKTKCLLNWIQALLSVTWVKTDLAHSRRNYFIGKVLFHPQTFSHSLFGFWHKCSKTILILIPSIPWGFYFILFFALDWELYFHDYTS